MHTCLECNQPVTHGVVDYSINKFGIILCMQHQEWIEFMSTQTTEHTIRLYFALKKRGVPAELERFDGYKHIAIAIPEAKVNIEVDGRHHNTDIEQARADLKRTFHSFAKGFYTLRIPNPLVYEDFVLEETADYIVMVLIENLKKLYPDRKF